MRPHKKLTVSEHPIDEMPQEMLAGIGEIVARWGYLQFQLGVIIREIAGLPKDMGRVLTLGPDLIVLCRMLRVLTANDHWIKDAALRADLADLAEAVKKASSTRNKYAHGVFGYGEKAGEFVLYLMQAPTHKVNPATEAIKIATLKAAASDARNLWAKAQELTRWLKTIPRTRR